MFDIAFYDGVKPKLYKEKSYQTLGEFYAQSGLDKFVEHPVKTECMMFSPIKPTGDGKRCKENVGSINLLVLDYDGVSNKSFDMAKMWCRGKEAFIYTSYSHSIKKGNSFRLVAMPSRPFSPEEYTKVMTGFEKLVGCGQADPVCIKDCARAYFMAYTNEVTDAMESTFFGGDVVDVDACLTLGEVELNVGGEVVTIERNVAIDHTLIKGHMNKLKRSKDTRKQLMARRLETLSQGKPLAEKDRHGVCIQLAAHLVVHFPEATEESIVGLFEASYIAMEGQEDWSATDRLKDLERSVTSACLKFRSVGQEKQLKEIAEQKKRVEKVLGPGARSYTDADIDRWADQNGCDRQTILNSWLIFKGPSIFVRKGDTYTGPFDTSDVWARLRDDLAPAAAYVDTKYYSDQGEQRKSIRQIQEEYGTTVSKVVFDWHSEDTRVDFLENELCIGLKKDHNLTPNHHEVVASWLEELAGQDVEQLKHWLALAPDLSQPLSMLYLEGGSQAGKGLLSAALPKIFGCRAAIDAVDWTTSFSDFGISPVIHVDEHLPPAWEGNSGFDTIKKEIQSRERERRPIFKSPVTLRGSLRYVATSNAALIKVFGQELNEANIDAICARFTKIRVPNMAKEFLEDFTPEELDLMRDVLIPEHILWLSEQGYEREGPYGIRGDNNSFAQSLRWAYGVNRGIAEFIIMFLSDPESYYEKRKASSTLIVEGGNIYIAPRALLQHWRLYVNNIKVPGADQLVRALRQMGKPVIKGKINMFLIDNQALKEYGESADMLTPEELKHNLVQAELQRRDKVLEADIAEITEKVRLSIDRGVN